MEPFLEALPLILAAIVPPLFAAVRKFLGEVIPATWIPVLLPVAGGVVAGIAHALGVDAAALQTTSFDPTIWQTVVEGILVGSASVGIHQIKRQRDKAKTGTG